MKFFSCGSWHSDWLSSLEGGGEPLQGGVFSGCCWALRSVWHAWLLQSPALYGSASCREAYLQDPAYDSCPQHPGRHNLMCKSSCNFESRFPSITKLVRDLCSFCAVQGARLDLCPPRRSSVSQPGAGMGSSLSALEERSALHICPCNTSPFLCFVLTKASLLPSPLMTNNSLDSTFPN